MVEVGISSLGRQNDLLEATVNNSWFREEEPLKGYRQWVWLELIERAKRNGVI